MKKDGDVFNVSSTNQRGGITAAKVYVGNMPRQLLEPPPELLPALRTKPAVQVMMAASPDEDSRRLGKTLYAYLTSELHWDTYGVMQAMGTSYELEVHTQGDGSERDPMGALARWLETCGLTGRMLTGQNGNHITIGPRP